MLKTAALIVVSAVACVSLWQWLSDDPQAAQTRGVVMKEYVVAPPTTPDPSPEPWLRMPASAAPAARPPTPVVPAGLGRKLLDAKDVKAFVLDALKQPEKGGALYASMALSQCSSEGVAQMKEVSDQAIQSVIANESTISAQRMEAISAWATRCAGFAPGEIEALNAEALKHGTDGTDPLLAMAVKAGRTRSGTSERAQALEAIYRSGNPALISNLSLPLRYLEESMIDNKDGTVIYRYNGQTYSDQADQRVIQAGAELSVCADDDYCSFDWQIQWQCHHAGTCYGSREEYVRKHLLLGDAAAYDKAQKVTNDIRSAIARGDRSIFR